MVHDNDVIKFLQTYSDLLDRSEPSTTEEAISLSSDRDYFVSDSKDSGDVVWNPNPASTSNVPPPPVQLGSKKRTKTGRACRECQRLKLKCDKKFPCSSCIKRGCSSICPDGHLTPDKGSRSVHSDSEALRERIDALTKRIREFEAAIRTIPQHHSYHQHSPLLQVPRTIWDFFQAISGSLIHSGVDNRLRTFENGLDILSACEFESPFVTAKSKLGTINLYGRLHHPPSSYLGNSKFREADGGYNNKYWPDVGRAGQPYARSVRAHTLIPESEFPDPGLVFDLLLQRRVYTPHPNGNSALTFAFASLVTHSLFRTNIYDSNINDTSSYLDLSPLYGNDAASQRTIRVMDGRGRIHPDSFVEERLVHLHPASSALLIMFNRNHNYTADMLLKINEKGAWRDPSSFIQDIPRLLKQDEDIFQTARLINCGHFMSMILNDFIPGFLGSTKNGKALHMRLLNSIYRSDGIEVGRGQGNHVSVEFNLLYRWHATVSEMDEKWTEGMMSKIFGTLNWQNITPQDFIRVAHDSSGPLFPVGGPKTRDNFPGMGIRRRKDGRYDDDDIARIIQDSTWESAHRYGARATPASLRVTEVMTILQGREWSVCTMNEFRKCMGLKPFASFEEWNSNTEIANAARLLYRHIDCLELYPGLQAEGISELYQGSGGFYCGYTTMCAIIADVIGLVRGDRFYTTDFTPGNLTSWGFGDVEPVQDNGAFGACLPKLLLRHLPDNYSYNSVYGLFPFFTPKAMREILAEQGVADKYDFSIPKPRSTVVAVETMRGIRAVFGDFENFKVTYTDNMNYLTQGYRFFLVFDEQLRHDNDKLLALTALWGQSDLTEFTDWYKNMTKQLIAEHSFSYDVSSSNFKGRYVDIVRNVINITSVRWAADYLTGLSLKNKEHPHGTFTEFEAYRILMVLFMCVFDNVDPEHGWFLRKTAGDAAKIMNDAIQTSIEESRARHPVSAFFARLSTILTTGSFELVERRPCHGFLKRLAESGRPLKDLTANVLGLAVGSSVNYAQASAQIVDFYLDDARAKERAEIVRLCATPENDEGANNLLIGYIKEAQRLAPQFVGLLRECESNEPIRIVQGSGREDVVIQPGQVVWGSYYNAHTNPIDFPDPFTVNPNRPRENYGVQGIGFHGCPGVQFAERTLLSVMRVIFSLRNLRRAPGVQGEIASFTSSRNGTPMRLFTDNKGAVSPRPGQLVVVYDE